MRPQEVYEQLKGTRIRNGELSISGFGPDEYEDLFGLIIETLTPILAGHEYYHWLGKKAIQYRVHRCRNRTYTDFYDPLTACRPEELSTRQQLAILKFALYRYKHSGYQREV